MPELSSAPDAERPIGQFITERVLPQWESLNEYPFMNRHNRVVTRAMKREGLQTHQMGGLDAVFLFNSRVVGGRFGRETTLVSDQAAEACSVKSLTRAYWDASGIPTEDAHHFTPDTADAAARFLAAATGPMVVKPDSARHGTGVSFGVTPDGLESAWKRAAQANRVPHIGAGVLLAEFRDALNLRFYVVGGHVRGVTLRVPLFVAGDGSSTVQQLLERSFAHQERNPLLRSTRPKITAQLVAATGLQLSDVPEMGALHILNEDPTVLRGGLPYDVTLLVSPELRRLASEAAVAIPGLGAAGIDVLTPSLTGAEGAVALDADSWATLMMHGYPAFGSRRIIGTPIARQLRLRADHWNRPAYSSAARVAHSPDEE